LRWPGYSAGQPQLLTVATITKSMWRYLIDNIVSATILGTSVSPSTDSSGVHKDVAAVLPSSRNPRCA